MKKTLVVLAAGLGSRYGGLKQMDPVGPSGEFLLDYGIYDAIKAGFDRLVFVIRREIEKDFEDVMGRRLKKQIPVVYVFQNTQDVPPGAVPPVNRVKPLGTGHAVWTCRNVVDGPFAVMNADDFYGRLSYEALGRFLDSTAANPAAYAMVGFVLRNTLSDYGSVARGICTATPDGCLQHIVETVGIEKSGTGILCPHRAFSGDEVVSMNLWGFKPSIFKRTGEELTVFLEKYGGNPKAEFFMPSVVDKLIVMGHASVRVLATTSVWFGMTNPEDRSVVSGRIRDLIQAGEYPENLWG